MNYVSTRGGGKPLGFTDILLEGLAPDGGLYVPQSYPSIDADTLQAMRRMSYAELAATVLGYFIHDIPSADLRTLVERTYTKVVFRSDDITPLPTHGIFRG